MLSDLDSLTEPESLVMAAAAAAAANSQASHQQQASAAITQQSQQQLEDEMLLLRLMDIPSQQQLNVTGIVHYTCRMFNLIKILASLLINLLKKVLKTLKL